MAGGMSEAARQRRPAQKGSAVMLDQVDRASRLQRNETIMALVPTPTVDALPRRSADFETLGAALDYAAAGVRGLNFHDPRGNMAQAYPYAQLRADALAN